MTKKTPKTKPIDYAKAIRTIKKYAKQGFSEGRGVR